MQIEVSGDVSVFVSDPVVRTALTNSIAAIAGVATSWVEVTLSVANRRLAIAGRRLQSSSVQVDYVINVPQEQATSASTAQSALFTTSMGAMTALVEAEISSTAGSGTYTMSIVGMSAPTVDGADVLTSTATSTTPEQSTAVATEESSTSTYMPTAAPLETGNEGSAAAIAGPQLALLIVLGLSGILIAATIAHWRLRKKGRCPSCRACKGDRCYNCNCWAGDGCGCFGDSDNNARTQDGWNEPTLDELPEDELPEDECFGPEMEVDYLVIPFEDGSLPMCQVKSECHTPAGSDAEEDDVEMNVDSTFSPPFGHCALEELVCQVVDDESLDAEKDAGRVCSADLTI
jgi:hypothetical protein